jgi:hypothetical protein
LELRQQRAAHRRVAPGLRCATSNELIGDLRVAGIGCPEGCRSLTREAV